ncbi:nucleotidyltransferase family protein, partial [Actinomadura adrarensis]
RRGAPGRPGRSRRLRAGCGSLACERGADGVRDENGPEGGRVDPSEIVDLVVRDPWRREVLEAVSGFGLPDCWIAAGFVRNVVWDHLHGHAGSEPLNDVDIIYFDGDDTDPERDLRISGELERRFPGETMSVENQARMHLRYGDPPYVSAADAMRRWPETATAVGISCSPGHRISAPFGLADLVGLVVRPSAPDMLDQVKSRVARKNWLDRWPRLRLEYGAG